MIPAKTLRLITGVVRDGSASISGVLSSWLNLLPLNIALIFRRKKVKDQKIKDQKKVRSRRSQEQPGGARRSQEEPGGARKSQEEPGEARRSQ